MAAPVQLIDEQFGGEDGGEDAGRRGGSSKTARAVRSIVDVETMEGEWDVFVDNWDRFKRM